MQENSDMQGTFDFLQPPKISNSSEQQQVSSAAPVIATPSAVSQMLDGMYEKGPKRCRGAVQGQKLLQKMGVDLQKAQKKDARRMQGGKNEKHSHPTGFNNADVDADFDCDVDVANSGAHFDAHLDAHFDAHDGDGEEYDSDHSDNSEDAARAGPAWQQVRVGIDADKQSDRYISFRLDKKYARYVAGAAHLPNLGSVWGYRDGSMMNFKDSVQLRQTAEGLIKKTINRVARNEFQVLYFFRKYALFA